MAEISTAEWMTVLETISKRPPDEANAEWEWLLAQLGLGPEYFLAIYAAVRQGRWRAARDPKAYLKTVAKREAAAMELPAPEDARLVFPGEIESDGERISQEERLDYMQHQYDNPRASQGADGVWRPGVGRRAGGNYRQLLAGKVPEELREIAEPSQELKEIIEDVNANRVDIHIRLRPLIKANWAQWAEAAGLDFWEQDVLRYMLDGVSRGRALEEQPNEDSRRALQAAWRKFERNGAYRLLEAAKKISKKMSPSEHFGTLE